MFLFQTTNPCIFTKKVFMTHIEIKKWKNRKKKNKNRNLLLYLLINCISSTSATQIIFLTVDYTLHFSNFLITGLCNYSANCSFKIVSFLIAPPKVLELPDLFARVAAGFLLK